MLKKVTLITGLNGAGKTSHGRGLAGLLDVQYVDMSRILKIAMNFWPDFHNEVVDPMARGVLVPDEMVLKPLVPYLSTLKKGVGFVCSGVPRTYNQVPAFVEAVETTVGISSFVALDLRLTAEMAIARCKERARKDGEVGEARADDVDEGVIRNRISTYNSNRDQLFEALAGFDVTFKTVDCHDDPQQTFSRIVRALGLEKELFINPILVGEN